ncbi:hypothetical protein BDN72DRAFT_841201 [Pluteus cervinus]|uniref:Uncharacterized protein n=1 Tax=Pluteus cervinus TaxID=181527 RepID=A0ACD3ATR0_9AGAR|nr:hypothetical protein BDN72DRAFT_841201 [Pluteus cervinus]
MDTDQNTLANSSNTSPIMPRKATRTTTTSIRTRPSLSTAPRKSTRTRRNTQGPATDTRSTATRDVKKSNASTTTNEKSPALP